jgi:hypothetical protein
VKGLDEAISASRAEEIKKQFVNIEVCGGM